MRTLTALLLTVGLLSAAPVPKGVKKPPSADGVWECVEFNSDGRSVDVPRHLRYWKVQGDRMSVGQETLKEASRPIGELDPFTLRTDDPAHPAQRMMVFEDGLTYHAIVEPDGDTLRWAYTRDRQPLAECKPGLQVYYFVLHRVKEK